jgi:hypothetical protein
LLPVGRRSGHDSQAAVAPELLLGPEALWHHDDGDDRRRPDRADARRRHDSLHFGDLRGLLFEPCFGALLCRQECIHLRCQALGAKELGTLELFEGGLPTLRLVDAFVYIDAAGPQENSEPVLRASHFAGGHVVGADGFAQHREATRRFDHPLAPGARANLLGQMPGIDRVVFGALSRLRLNHHQFLDMRLQHFVQPLAVHSLLHAQSTIAPNAAQ